MKKVIVCTYYWPPSGGPAVQRWLSFSNFLVKKGVEVCILTPDPEKATFPFIDEKLVPEIDSKIQVIHVPLRDNFKFYKKIFGKAPAAGFINEKPSLMNKMIRFIRGNFIFPDPRKNWTKKAVNIASALISEKGYNNIITAGPPHSTHFIGLEIKAKHSTVNWICDFHDAWTDIWFYDKLLKTSIAKNIDSKLEIKILSNSDVVLTVGEFLLNKLKAKLQNTTHQPEFKLVTMGYDDNLIFRHEISKNDVFTIRYTGTMDEQYNPTIIFDSIVKIIEEGFKIKLHFIGLVSDTIKAEVAEMRLNNTIEFTSYVPHKESIEFLNTADCLLLVSPKVRSEKLIIPGKVYEYLASQKPIINIGDKLSNTAKIVEECESGLNIDRNDSDILTDFLRDWIEKWEEDKTYTPFPKNNIYRKYSRSAETEKVYELLQ